MEVGEGVLVLFGAGLEVAADGAEGGGVGWVSEQAGDLVVDLAHPYPRSFCGWLLLECLVRGKAFLGLGGFSVASVNPARRRALREGES